MGIPNFIIVLSFNLWWAMRYGLDGYGQMYKFDEDVPKWVTIVIWLYAAWGIANLIVACI
jgi:hypothetical protein